MNYAAALLKSDKSLKVADVAGLVGYDSPEQIYRCFSSDDGKNAIGISEINYLIGTEKAAWSGRKKLNHDKLRMVSRTSHPFFLN